MKFIKVNNRILDYEKHKEELSFVKNDILLYIDELVRAYGFEREKNSFVNKSLNLKLELKFEALDEEVFV
ncbi:MAG: hypothetical protein KJ583_01105 [Nanoarchaeota archaeon]|nr:hypothetical protein [Nanoarchaeota archaeon]MBU1269498.1 hypothetical protein [Nanoarchaeota archaeon]MBU1603889.1 hypothetical protein [Nanoarchaeota archaeon]MBU2443339.1 hypothetical protein [Nanoarchaeota archaeon]